MASLGVLILGQPQNASQPCTPTLYTAKILAFAKASASIPEIQDMPERVQRFAFEDSRLNPKDLVAFEEQQLFVYAVSEFPQNPAGRGSTRSEAALQFVRRIIFLKPSIFVVDDEISGPLSSGSVAWLLYSQKPPKISGQQSRFAEKDGELLCETLLPEKASLKAMDISGDAQKTDRTGLRVDLEKAHGRTRFLNVISVGGHGTHPPQINSKLSENGGRLELVISAGQQVFQLSLPPIETVAGEIAIAGSDGKFLLDRRPFPAGLFLTDRRG